MRSRMLRNGMYGNLKEGKRDEGKEDSPRSANFAPLHCIAPSCPTRQGTVRGEEESSDCHCEVGDNNNNNNNNDIKSNNKARYLIEEEEETNEGDPVAVHMLNMLRDMRTR